VIWVKALHIVFVMAWLAGLLYLPRLFVYHAMCEDAPGKERFKVMERKLHNGIMAPSGILSLVFGLWLLFGQSWNAYPGQWWLHLKLFLAALLIAYHLYCIKLLADFRLERGIRSRGFYRWINEVPAVLMLGIVLLAVAKPF